MAKVGPFMQMAVFGIGDGSWSPVDKSGRGDPQGVQLLLFYSTFKWHEELPRSSSLVFLEWDEEAHWGLYPMMSHVSIGKD